MLSCVDQQQSFERPTLNEIPGRVSSPKSKRGKIHAQKQGSLAEHSLHITVKGLVIYFSMLKPLDHITARNTTHNMTSGQSK